jgi:hypothetical protein
MSHGYFYESLYIASFQTNVRMFILKYVLTTSCGIFDFLMRQWHLHVFALLPPVQGGRVPYCIFGTFVPFLCFIEMCIFIYPCNENQLDALLILSLFRQSISACFGHICSPSSGGTLYIFNNWYVLCFSVYCLLASQLKSTTHTNCWIYTVYLLMMGYRYAQNMQRLIDEIN